MKTKFGSKCELINTDTEKLREPSLKDIQMEDIYKDMVEGVGFYDTSNYPKDHMLYSDRNKKVMGKMKDECEGRTIVRKQWLEGQKCIQPWKKTKKYIMNTKGVKNNVEEKEVRHEHYKEAERTFFTARATRNMNFGQFSVISSFRISGSFPSFRLLGFRVIFRHSAVLPFHVKDFRGFSAVPSFHLLGFGVIFRHSVLPPFHCSTVPSFQHLGLSN